MATTTPRIGLTKPDLTDLVDVGVLNTNFDKIDSNIASTKIQATKPTTANSGDLWWDSDTGTLYVYYVGASSSSWVAATSDPINIGVVANQTERDAQYPTPAQGMRVFRTDLGVTQTYYGLYNVSTNPGGRDVAGWYDTEKTQGLVPIMPSTVNVDGTATIDALGGVTVSGSTYLQLNGVFTDKFNTYKIVAELTGSLTNNLYTRFCAAGNSDSAATYKYGGLFVSVSQVAFNTGNAANDLAVIGAGATAGTSLEMTVFNTRNTIRTAQIEFVNTTDYQTIGFVTKTEASKTFDGLRIWNIGTISGRIAVYGYNK